MTLDNVAEIRIAKYASPYTQFVNPQGIFSDSGAVSLSGTPTSATPYHLLRTGWSGADAPQITATFTPSAAGQGGVLTSYKVGSRNLVLPVTHDVSATHDRTVLDATLFGGTLGADILLGVNKPTGFDDRFLLGCVYQGGFDRSRRNSAGTATFGLAFASEWAYFVGQPVVAHRSGNRHTLNVPDMPGPVLWGMWIPGDMSSGTITVSSDNGRDFAFAMLWQASRRDFEDGDPTDGILILPGFPYALFAGFQSTVNNVPSEPVFGLDTGRLGNSNRLAPYMSPGQTYIIDLIVTGGSGTPQVFYLPNYAGL